MTQILKELKLDGQRVLPVLGTMAEKYDLLDDALSRVNIEYDKNEALSREAGLAAESLDSIVGDLGDSWDGLILSFEKGDGIISQSIKQILKLSSSVLKFITVMNKALTIDPNNRIIKQQKRGYFRIIKS